MNTLALIAIAASLGLCSVAQAQGTGCNTRHVTKLIKDGESYCFTIRPLPQCRASCTATSTTEKNVPVHCVEKSQSAHHWEKLIEKGGQSLDFSRKPTTKTLRATFPLSCAPARVFRD